MTRYFHRIGAGTIDELLTKADLCAEKADKARGDVVAFTQSTGAFFGSVELVALAHEDGDGIDH